MVHLTASQLHMVCKVRIFFSVSQQLQTRLWLFKAVLAELLEIKGGGLTGSALTGREGP